MMTKKATKKAATPTASVNLTEKNKTAVGLIENHLLNEQPHRDSIPNSECLSFALHQTAKRLDQAEKGLDRA